jgi:hypothetical protein
VKSGFGDASEVFGEDAAIGEFSVVVGPADAEVPAAFNKFSASGGHFRDRNDEDRLQVGVEGPNALSADEELHGGRSGVAGLIATAIDDDESAELASGAINAEIGFGRRQERSEEEHGQTSEGGEPGVPKGEREDDQGGARETEKDAKHKPSLGTAAQVNYFGDEKQESKKCAHSRVAEF